MDTRPDTPTPNLNSNDTYAFEQLQGRMRVALRQAGYAQNSPVMEMVGGLDTIDGSELETSMLALVVGLCKRMDELMGQIANLSTMILGSNRQPKAE